MEKVYAAALASAASKPDADEAKLVSGLVKHLESVGRMKLLPGILRELKAKEARAQALAPILEVASDGEKAAAVTAAKAEGIETKDVRVNDSLISGWRVRSGSKLIDRSGKQALVELYRNIVTK
ncbi:MAG: hypothetical protein AAB892_02300 [Patescibacteria group bacterium]